VDLRKRSHDAERMDDPAVPLAGMAEALQELDGINAWLGGHSTSLSLLRHRLPMTRPPGGRPVRLLDVGAGGGGTANYLSHWAQDAGIDLEITLLDIHPAVCRVAAAAVRDEARLHVVRGDAFRLPFADGEFDFAHSALFLHHFPQADVVRLLAEMRRVASAGVVINDLHRHRVAYHSIRLIARLFIRSPIVRHDAPLSVRRGFRSGDLDGWRDAEALRSLGYRRRWPFRWAAWVFADGGGPRGAESRV
jgi:SAM-dependent methyltransferase